jgi:hypothetical protein
MKRTKKDLRLKGKLVVLTRVVVDQDEGKPGLGRLDGQSLVQLWKHNLLL